MTLTTAEIERRLTASGWMTEDNTAQDIINGATDADLASVDARGVILLVQALERGWVSARDRAARERLQDKTQFQPIANAGDLAVSMIKASPSSNANVQRELSAGIVTRIYAAEHSRLDWWEGGILDGETIGRGQLSQASFETMRNMYVSEWQAFFTRWVMSHYVQRDTNHPSLFFIQYSTQTIRIPTDYSRVYRHEPLEDFVVAAYFANRMKRSTSGGRSSRDVARFAAGHYHGMFQMMRNAQVATGDDINWAPIGAHLLANGNADAADYVDEVIP